MVSISHGLTRFSNVLCSESDKAAGGRGRTMMQVQQGSQACTRLSLITFGRTHAILFTSYGICCAPKVYVVLEVSLTRPFQWVSISDGSRCALVLSCAC